MTVLPFVIGGLGTVSKRLVNGLGNKRTIGDHLNYSIAEIDQNTLKSPRDLRRLVLTHTQWEYHQVSLL